MSNKTDPQMEELLVDYLDGTLNDSKKALVERYLLQNPDMAESISAFNEIRLAPDENLVYENKASLKRLHIRNFPFILKYAVAAGGALLIGLALWLNSGNIASDSPVVAHTVHQAQPSVQSSGASISENTLPKAQESHQAIAQLPSNVVKQDPSAKSVSVKAKNVQRTLVGNATTRLTNTLSKEKQNNNEAEAVLLANNTQSHEYPVIAALPVNAPANVVMTTSESTPFFKSGYTVVFQEKTQSQSIRMLKGLIPERFTTVKREVNQAIAENSVQQISGKLKGFFLKEKLTEALVPTLVQQDLSSL